MKQTLSYFWKVLLCSFGFFVGLVLNSIVLNALGFQVQQIPFGAHAINMIILIFMGSILITLVLSYISRKLQTNWFIRWIILLELIWLLSICGISVGLSLLSTMGTLAIFTVCLVVMLNFLLPGLLLSGLVTILFQPAKPFESCSNNYPLPSNAISHPVQFS